MASHWPLVIDSRSYSLGIALRQMRLSIKIQITWLNNNLLGYLPKYKSLLPLPVKLSGPQPYTRAYVDDIVSFSKLLEKHLQHL